MRIAYLGTSIIPSKTANSIHVMKMCHAFAANGHEVTLIVPNRRDAMEQGVADVFEFYGVDKVFQIVFKRWLRLPGRGYVYGFLAARTAKSLQPDIVYGRSVVAIAFATFLGLPAMLELHQPVADGNRLVEWLFLRAIRRKNFLKVVTITHRLARYLRETYPDYGINVTVAADAADPVPDKIEQVVLNEDGTRLQVGYTGHLFQGKGVELILETARLCPWADFHVVGGYRHDVERIRKLMNPQLPNVTLHGFVQQRDLATYRASFDVLVAPYENNVYLGSGAQNDIGNWMSPLKLFEYMAAGKAIISSDLPVLREVLRDGHNAILCAPSSPTEWATALRSLRDDSELLRRLGENAYRDFVSNYTWKSRVFRVLEHAIT